MKQALPIQTEKGITRSMSRKGTPADNACIEWFHSVLKSETFYLHNWRNLTKDSITDIVKNYIIFYNETRIQQRLNDQSPVDCRNLVAYKGGSSVPLLGCSTKIEILLEKKSKERVIYQSHQEMSFYLKISIRIIYFIRII